MPFPILELPATEGYAMSQARRKMIVIDLDIINMRLS